MAAHTQIWMIWVGVTSRQIVVADSSEYTAFHNKYGGTQGGLIQEDPMNAVELPSLGIYQRKVGAA